MIHKCHRAGLTIQRLSSQLSFEQDPEVNDASSSHFFIFHFFTSFSFFHSPRCSFLLVPPSSLSLFLPRPALSKSFRIRKSPFFSDFDKSITDGPTNGPINQPTDKASYDTLHQYVTLVFHGIFHPLFSSRGPLFTPGWTF